MRRRFGAGALLCGCWLLAMGGQANCATCVEGLIMLEKTLRQVQLSDEEYDKVADLMFKAKVEADRGHSQTCVFIVGDIIRLVFMSERN
jgi:hypothetical protein